MESAPCLVSLNDARPALAELEKSVRERRLAQWRERIENDIKYASNG